MRPPPIYVDILIDAPLDSVLQHAQEPNLHPQWDPRFPSIEYLPKTEPSSAQRLLYTTKLSFGIGVAGGGRT